jgi:cytochrome P450
MFDQHGPRGYNATSMKGKAVSMPQLIPPGPRGRPPIEDLRALQIGPHAFLQRAAAQYGDVLRGGALPVYVVSHPDGVKQILQDNARNYSAAVAQRYRLRHLPGHEVAVEPSVTLRPKHGLMMTLQPRT